MKNFNKRDYSILIGNLLDHFDSALYGFLAPIIAPLFFPNQEPVVQLILAYSILSTSVITRPIGAVIFGFIASKHGPLITMSYSLIGVAIGSIWISFVPDYNSIGSFAPILLIIIRSIKGIFSAGESAIAKLYIIQDKHYDNAYKASYLYQASSMIGTIIASGMVAFILWSNNYHLWRWCFLISGLVCIIAYILRISDSTNHNKLLFKKQTFELKLKQYIVPISAIAFSTGLSHITYAIPCIVMNSLIPLICDITLAEMIELNTVLLGVDMILIFVCGHILRKIHYNYIMIFSSLILMITVPILFVFLPDSDLWYITFVRIWIIFLGVIFMCPQNLYYFNIMNLSLDTKNNKNNQYLVAGIANALGAGIIGRTVPALSMWIWYITDNVTYIAAYIAIIAFMTTIFITMTANMPRN